MSTIRNFYLDYFPEGNNDLSFGGFPVTNEAMVLYFSDFDTDTGEDSPFIVLGYLGYFDGEVSRLSSPPLPDGSGFTISYYSESHELPHVRNSVQFQYIAGGDELHYFMIKPSAMSYIVGTGDSSGGGQLEGYPFVSLNGADGSYADGTPVTVVGRDGAFKVLASRNFYNDSKDSQNMLIYFLERTDLTHKPTMLVADIYVKKVVTP